MRLRRTLHLLEGITYGVGDTRLEFDAYDMREVTRLFIKHPKYNNIRATYYNNILSRAVVWSGERNEESDMYRHVEGDII